MGVGLEIEMGRVTLLANGTSKDAKTPTDAENTATVRICDDVSKTKVTEPRGLCETKGVTTWPVIEDENITMTTKDRVVGINPTWRYSGELRR